MSSTTSNNNSIDAFRLRDNGSYLTLGLFAHAILWFVVCTLLCFINFITTFFLPPWFLYVTLGWLILFIIHAITTIIVVDQRGGCVNTFFESYSLLVPTSWLTFIKNDGNDRNNNNNNNSGKKPIFNICFCGENDEGSMDEDNEQRDHDQHKKETNCFLIKNNGSMVYLIFVGHGLVWLTTSVLLFVINLTSTLLFPPWFLGPTIIWGLIWILFHGPITFFVVNMQKGDFYKFTEYYYNVILHIVEVAQKTKEKEN